MTFTAASQNQSATPALDFMTSLDTLLVAAGFTYVEQYPTTTPVVVRLASAVNVAAITGLLTVDGVQTVAGDRVLLRAQTTASQNGIYVAASGAWSRSSDMNTDGSLVIEQFVQNTATSTTYAAGYLHRVSAVGTTPWLVGSSTSTWASSGPPSLANTTRVYKSPAASNSFGQDWFLFINRTTDFASVVSVGVAEVWDTTTKKSRNYAPSTASLTPTAAFAVNDAVGVSTTGALQKITLQLSLTGFQYWVSASPDRVVLASRYGLTEYGVYAGLYDDLLPVAISPFPLCVVNLTQGSSGVATGGAGTREPNQLASAISNFMVYVSSTFSWTPTGSSLDIYSVKYLPVRVPLMSGRSGNSAGIRGLLKKMLYVPVSSEANGDVMTVTDSVGTVTTYGRMSDSTFPGLWADKAA